MVLCVVSAVVSMIFLPPVETVEAAVFVVSPVIEANIEVIGCIIEANNSVPSAKYLKILNPKIANNITNNIQNSGELKPNILNDSLDSGNTMFSDNAFLDSCNLLDMDFLDDCNKPLTGVNEIVS